jgi:hypothetical protein
LSFQTGGVSTRFRRLEHPRRVARHRRATR